MTVAYVPFSRPSPIPPLQNRDRLTRLEFLKRYAAMPSNVKAERIEGRVYMPAAVSVEHHAQPHVVLVTWLGTYWAATPGTAAADNGTIALDLDNDPQPDACLRILPSHGGRTTFTSEGFIEGAPDLIVEVAASSASYDLGEKLNAYRRNGVREYLVQRVYDRAFDWFILRGGQYERQLPDSDGIIRSETFPGLRLDVAALVAEKPAEVLAVLQRGIATPEHAEFVKRLESQQTAS